MDYTDVKPESPALFMQSTKIKYNFVSSSLRDATNSVRTQ